MGPRQGGPHATMSNLNEMEQRWQQQLDAQVTMKDKEWEGKLKARDEMIYTLYKELEGKLNDIRAENQQQHKKLRSVQTIYSSVPVMTD